LDACYANGSMTELVNMPDATAALKLYLGIY